MLRSNSAISPSMKHRPSRWNSGRKWRGIS
jgi:hypothetical protein